MQREYQPWHDPRLIIDNVGKDPAAQLANVLAYLARAT
jgi:hypothetical protein